MKTSLNTEWIKDDIEVPPFYQEKATLEGIEFYQGAHFMDRPQYSKNEQFFCAIEGAASFLMVPHINRQEVYGGKLTRNLDSAFYDH